MLFGYTMMLIAITISAIAAWYSIAGLTAIFAAAVIPVIIMGGALEAGKIVATVFLHNQWKRISWLYKAYLVPAIVFLMLLTSMGIFGFLSKAHSDQSLVSGDASSKVAIYDEQIKVEQDNIASAKKALQQMDAQVDQMLGRTDSDKGAERAVTIRKQQAKERTSLQSDITKSQKKVAQLQQERAPLAAELRKVEAEVGPIKYIAAFIYGDNPDQNVLEKAVRWVIILIVIVFDPLALCLILASNKQLEWAREDRKAKHKQDIQEAEEEIKDVSIFFEELNKQVAKEHAEDAKYEADDGPLSEDQLRQIEEHARAQAANKAIAEIEPEEEKIVEILGPKVDNVLEAKSAQAINPKPFPGYDEPKSLFAEVEVPVLENEEMWSQRVIDEQKEVTPVTDFEALTAKPQPVEKEITVDDVTTDLPVTAQGTLPEYVSIEGKSTSLAALRGSNPSLFQALVATADGTVGAKVNFGTEFPRYSRRGDIFTRVDVLPNRVYKFTGNRWIEVKREDSQTYLDNENYVQHLIQKLETGEYDPEWLTDDEREIIAKLLTNSNNES